MNYLKKDELKFEVCNKLISRGCAGSSSDRYLKDFICNEGVYTESDFVGVSVNGNRRDRVSCDWVELDLAIAAGATIVKDNTYHTNRGFNVGEREVREYLEENGYFCMGETTVASFWESIDPEEPEPIDYSNSEWADEIVCEDAI